MSKCRSDKPKRRELALVHTTPRTFPRNICPVAILSAYLTARKRLAGASDSNFLFPNLHSYFEPGTNRQISTITTPVECVQYDSYRKKLAMPLDSTELNVIRVNFLNYSSDSFKLGGLMAMSPNKVVTLVFSHINTTILPSTPPVYFSEMAARSLMGKSTLNKAFLNRDPIIKYIGKPDAADSKATKTSSSVPNTESATSVEA